MKIKYIKIAILGFTFKNLTKINFLNIQIKIFEICTIFNKNIIIVYQKDRASEYSVF